MQDKLDKYTKEIKIKLNNNLFSPQFIRLANLLYLNEDYEYCISVCKTGLEIYPHYLTAKLIMLKSFLKAEYLNEAELLFIDIKSKLTNKELLAKFQSNIQTLKNVSKQEKIYYSSSNKNKFDYKSFERKFQSQENLFSDFKLSDLLDKNPENKFDNDKDFINFTNRFKAFHFETGPAETQKASDSKRKVLPSPDSDQDLLKRIKIVTETLADIYAAQGNYKEAFEAYNILLRAGSGNSKRIEEKINELERDVSNYDRI